MDDPCTSSSYSHRAHPPKVLKTHHAYLHAVIYYPHRLPYTPSVALLFNLGSLLTSTIVAVALFDAPSIPPTLPPKFIVSLPKPEPIPPICVSTIGNIGGGGGTKSALYVPEGGGGGSSGLIVGGFGKAPYLIRGSVVCPIAANLSSSLNIFCNISYALFTSSGSSGSNLPSCWYPLGPPSGNSTGSLQCWMFGEAMCVYVPLPLRIAGWS
jgi:hypothetical protein